MDFNAGYVPPGVYVSTQSTGSTGVVGIGDTVVCLVGRGRGYQTYTENVSFAGGDTVQLSQLGIDASSVVVTGTVAGVPTTFVEDVTGTPHDYSLTQTDGSNTDSVTSIVRTASGQIQSTDTVTVSYHYTPASYYELNSFTDFATLSAVYGPALDPVTGAVSSPLTLAAQLAFQNGANVLYAIALSGQGATKDQFNAALNATLPNLDINLVVPLFEDAIDAASAEAELTQLSAYLSTAEGDALPRVAIVGLPSGFSGTSPDVLAQAVAYRRVVLTWPQQFNYFNPVLNTTTTIDGMYFAAACAGYLANNLPNQGLTRQQMYGFSGIPNTVLTSMTRNNKDLWSSRGVTVVEPNRLAQLIVRHGVTTDVSNIGTREIPIVRCQDALYELIQVTLDTAGLIGDPITSNTPLQIKALVAGALETALASGTINAYQNLLVSQQSLPQGDPTVIQVTFDYQPTYPLNYITVVFTLNLTSGQISTLTSDTAGGASGSVNNLTNVAGV